MTAVGLFEIAEIGEKTADVISNWLELHWLSRYPWHREMTVDKGKEFATSREVSNTLTNKHCDKWKIMTSYNPQVNSMIERCHKTLHNMIHSAQIKDKRDLDSFFGFKGVLAACRKSMNSTAHTTARAMPTQLVFGHDAKLNASFQAHWQFIEEHKQGLVTQNNKRKNAKRTPHTYNVGDVVVVKAGAKRKHDCNPYLDPMRITQVNDNGTVKLVKVANNGGAVSQTWNVRNIEPRMASSPRCYCQVALQDCGNAIKSSRAATSLHRSKLSTLISQLTWTVVIGENATP